MAQHCAELKQQGLTPHCSSVRSKHGAQWQLRWPSQRLMQSQLPREGLLR